MAGTKIIKIKISSFMRNMVDIFVLEIISQAMNSIKIPWDGKSLKIDFGGIGALAWSLGH